MERSNTGYESARSSCVNVTKADVGVLYLGLGMKERVTETTPLTYETAEAFDLVCGCRLSSLRHDGKAT